MSPCICLWDEQIKKKRVDNRKSDLIMFTVHWWPTINFEVKEDNTGQRPQWALKKKNKIYVWIELRSNFKTVNGVSIRMVFISYSTISKSCLLCDTIAIAHCCIIQLYQKQCLIFDAAACLFFHNRNQSNHSSEEVLHFEFCENRTMQKPTLELHFQIHLVNFHRLMFGIGNGILTSKHKVNIVW